MAKEVPDLSVSKIQRIERYLRTGEEQHALFTLESIFRYTWKLGFTLDVRLLSALEQLANAAEDIERPL